VIPIMTLSRTLAACGLAAGLALAAPSGSAKTLQGGVSTTVLAPALGTGGAGGGGGNPNCPPPFPGASNWSCPTGTQTGGVDSRGIPARQQNDGGVYCQTWPGHASTPQYPGTGPQTPCGPAFQRNDGGTQSPPDNRQDPQPSPPLATQTTREIALTSIAWISEKPSPFDAVGGAAGGVLFGAADVFTLQPTWLVKTYLGLIATANPPPPARLTDLGAFRATKEYRALLHARIRLVLDGAGAPVSVTVDQQIIDGGWTVPFRLQRFPAVILPGISSLVTRSPADAALLDGTTYPGEASIASAVGGARHPNSTLSFPSGERVIVDGLIRFRAGAHTDGVGVAIGSPFHVPWVWNEFALTYGGGQLRLYGRASAFPTTTWYVDGQRVVCQPRLSDSSFPTTGGFGLTSSGVTTPVIDTSRLRAWPALSVGSPAGDPARPRPQAPDNRPSGVIAAQPFTVAPAGPEWRMVLDGPPPAASTDPACR
jgi:hypothetical protein